MSNGTSGVKEKKVIEIRGEYTCVKREIIEREVLTTDFAAELAKNAENDTRWLPRGERRIVTKKAGTTVPLEIFLLIDMPKIFTIRYTGKDHGDPNGPTGDREYQLCMPPILYAWTFAGQAFRVGYAYGLDNASPGLFNQPDDDIKLYATPMPNIHNQGEGYLCMGQGFAMDLALPTVSKVQKCMHHWFTSPWNSDLSPAFGQIGSTEAPTISSLKHWHELTVQHGDKAWNHFKMKQVRTSPNITHFLRNLKGGDE